jgi:hypothetical protein
MITHSYVHMNARPWMCSLLLNTYALECVWHTAMGWCGLCMGDTAPREFDSEWKPFCMALLCIAGGRSIVIGRSNILHKAVDS